MEIKSIYFEISSDKLKTVNIYMEDENWYEEIEPDIRCVTSTHLVILTSVEDTNGNEVEYHLGFIKGIFFNIDEIASYELDMCSIFDSYSQETYDVYVALTSKNGSLKKNYIGTGRNIFLIERIYIEEEYRNKGIASLALKRLVDVLKYSLNFDVGCLMLQPRAQEKDERGNLELVKDTEKEVKLTKQLRNFYRRLGFKSIPNNEHMYFNTDYVMGKSK